MFGDTVLLVLKTARYVDPTEVVELGEILVFVGEDFVITVRHGEASDLHGVRERLERNPELLSAGPAPWSTRSWTRWWTTTSRPSTGSSRTWRRWRARCSRRPGRTAPSGSTGSSARCSSSTARPRRCWSRSTGSRAAASTSSPRRSETYFRDVNDHLLRVHEQLESLRDLLTCVLQANLTQVTVRQNEDVRKISAVVAHLRGAHDDRRHLRHELRAHAGARLELRLSRSRSRLMAVLCTGLFRYFRRVGWL